MKRMPIVAAAVVLVFTALFLACMGAFVLVEIPLVLFFGWIFFLLKTLPHVRPDWSAIGLALISLALLIGGTHRAGRRWANGRKSTAVTELADVTANEPQIIWKVRWTVSAVTALLLIFTAGISVVGAVHQAVWMMTGKERLIASDWYVGVGRSMSRNNLKAIGLGVHNYADAHGSVLPGGTFDADGHPLHSTMTMILPYIEQQALFSGIDLQQPWNGIRNRTAFETVVPTYRFSRRVPNPELTEEPGEVSGFALTNYAGNVHVLRPGRVMRKSDISDGTSNTILFGEVIEGLRPWGDPLNVRDPAAGINKGRKSFGSPFSQGCNILLSDGSSRFVSEDIAPEVLKALSTPASGDPVPEY